MKAAVFVAGSWGTAFAQVLADAGTDVSLWARRQEQVDAINAGGINHEYLPRLQLSERIRATADVAQACAQAQIVVLAAPSQSLRDNLAAWAPHIPRDATIVSLAKGIELGSGKRMSEVICEAAQVPADRVVVVSGPNLAHEIAAKHPAAAVVAGSDTRRTEAVAAACAAPYFRPYTQDDVVGTEIGGSCKNVVALAVGMAEGMGLGDNTKATIITRGLAETSRLGVALGADPITFLGLAGVGDLVATCMSPLSRNHTFGIHLGRGMSMDEVVSITRQTAEGVKSCRSIAQLARDNGVDVPITEVVEGVLYGGMSMRDVVGALMTRALKQETQ